MERGWKQVVFGHIGRKPDGSLAKVARRLGQLLGCDATLIPDWLDPDSSSVTENAQRAVADAPAGSLLVFENTRKYNIETVLWKATPQDVGTWIQPLANFATSLAEKVARVYVHEALSAGSLDASSTIVPAAMDKVALGQYVSQEFEGPMQKCRDAQLVVFSGLKADKLDDLEAMVARGKVRVVFAAGSLSMALRKAVGKLEGKQVCLGLAEDRSHADQPYYIPQDRVEQARRMIENGRQKGIEFVLPVDSIRQDGKAVDALGPQDQQFDIGPKSSQLFEDKIGQFIERFAKSAGSPAVAFHNGVFGKFEEPQFAEGTRRFMSQLKRLKDAGVLVYIGGGEGGAALEQYGSEDWVTHVFTAGGTVLNALGSKPVPYLAALRMAAQRK
jgi:phosphoglycerate kinase